MGFKNKFGKFFGFGKKEEPVHNDEAVEKQIKAAEEQEVGS